jgi:TDG/mug DNA glycosylase family protein
VTPGTLPDFLAADLRLLSIGLNPSPRSVAAGFYFANPRNRFWRALNASALLDAELQPGLEAMRQLLHRKAIGFTDLVKRSTRGAAQLRANDYRTGAARLRTLILKYQPDCAWFHGKLAYNNFARFTGLDSGGCQWGFQDLRIGRTWVFVSPNPSPANAAFSLDDLVACYDELAALLGSGLSRGRCGRRH